MTRTPSGLSRGVIKAMSLFGSLQVLTILCSIIRVKFTALWIGATGVGLFAIFNSAFTLISTLTQLNLRSTSVREIAATRPELRSAISATVRRLGWMLGLAGAVVMLAASPIFSLRTFGGLSHTTLFAALAIAVLFTSAAAAEQGVMQGHGDLRRLARATLWANIAGLAASLPLIYLLGEQGVIPSIIAYALAAYCATRILRRRPATPGSRPTALREGFPMLRLGLLMTLAAAFTELLAYLLIAWINTRGDTAEVGIFQAGYTMVNRYVGMVFTAIGMEFYPRLATVVASQRRQQVFVSHEMIMLLIVLVPLTICFIPFVGLAVRLLYSTQFLDAVPYVILALPGMVARIGVWCQSMVILARGDGRLYIITEALSDLLTLAIALVCYSHWGIPGLGWGFTLSMCGAAAISSLTYRYIYHLRLAPVAIRLWVGGFLASAAAAGTWIITIHLA